MKNKKWLLLVLFIILIFIIIIYVINHKEKNENVEDKNFKQIEQKNLEPVKNHNLFFAVQTCVEKYLTYVANENKDEILMVLDEEYIKDNNINKNNVLEKINNNDILLNFHAEEMYFEEINDDINKYYVSGYQEATVDNDYEDDSQELFTETEASHISQYMYFEVKLDFENMIFSIKPIENGGIFNEKSN